MTTCLKTVITFIRAVQLQVTGKRGTKSILLETGCLGNDQVGTTRTYNRKMIIMCSHTRKAAYFMSVGTKPPPCFSTHSDARKMFYIKVKLQNTICGNPPLLLPFILPSTPTIPDAQRPPQNPLKNSPHKMNRLFRFGHRQHPESVDGGPCFNYTRAVIYTDSSLKESVVAVLYQLPCWWGWLTCQSSGGLVNNPVCSQSAGGLNNGGSHGLDQLARGVYCCWCWLVVICSSACSIFWFLLSYIINVFKYVV